MADLNFPASPVDGDTYLDYVYDDATDSWILKRGISIEKINDVKITSLGNDQIITYSNSQSNWVNSSNTFVPTGAIFPYPAEIAPQGYLVCNGQIISQSEYSKLYSVIGSSYNVGGEPSGTFRLPDLASRVPVGVDSSQTEFTPLGKSGGAETHKLSIEELATHTHTQNAHTHTQNAHNHTQSSHSHSATFGFGAPGGSAGYGFFGSFRNRVGVTGGWGLGTSSSQPGIDGRVATNQNARAENLPTGGDLPHNNVQPYLVTNYIVKV